MTPHFSVSSYPAKKISNPVDLSQATSTYPVDLPFAATESMFTSLLFLLTDGMLRCNCLQAVLNEMVQVFPSGYCVAMGSAFVGKQLRFSVIILLLICCTAGILNWTRRLRWFTLARSPQKLQGTHKLMRFFF